MKKTLLSLVVLAGAAIAAQAQTPLYTCEFGPKYNSAKVSAYNNSTFNVTYPETNGSTWVVKNYNNNNTGAGAGTWTYIKAGHKTTGNTATIVNQLAYPQKITKVVVTIDKILSINNKDVEETVSNVALLIGSSADITASTAASTVDFDAADFPASVVGSSATPYALTFDIPAADQAENMFYVFTMTFPAGLGSNGLVQVSKLEFYGESSKASAETEFPAAAYTAYLGETFDAPKATTASDGALTYSSSNPDVAEVDETTGAVTIKAVGTTNITATTAATDTYYEGQAQYTLTVALPPVTFEKATKMIDGKYILAHDGEVAYPGDESKTFYYLNALPATVDGNKIKTDRNNAFTFTKEADGWTIMDSYGRYLYFSGSYKSFNVSTTPSSGQYWDITLDAATGEAKIVNKARTDNTLNTIVWVVDGSYREFCAGAETATDLPTLYIEEDPAAIGAVAADNADVNAPIEYYNLQGMKVANPQGGVFIKRQGDKAVKVML